MTEPRGDRAELVPGEDLTLRQRQAAVLEAAGLDTTGIGITLKLNKKTIERWRREEPQYNIAVKEYESRAIQDLEPIVQRIQLDMAVAVEKAITTIISAMDANTKAGTPAWAARLKAAADALNHAKLIAPATLTPKVEGGVGNAQFAVIRVEVPEGSTAEAQPAIEAEVIEPDA